MSVHPDIHDKAYQFFIEEAAELLQIIEDGILELRKDRGANTVHAVMRAAHSIKGGAASVELEAIKTIAHRLETAFRALYDETVDIDDELEGLLLDGYDCLKDPLNEQIDTGSHDPDEALAQAMPILEAIEAKLGPDALRQADSFIPSSSDLGVDMVTSIFEMDVEEGIARLEEVAANPSNFPVLGEIQAQAEVFIGFGELLDLPGFGSIAEAMLNASRNNPEQAVELLNVSLVDLKAARDVVMAGDRDQGGSPSEALLALAGGSSPTGEDVASDAGIDLSALGADDLASFGLSEADLAGIDLSGGLSDLSLEEASLSDAGLGQGTSEGGAAAENGLGGVSLDEMAVGDLGLNDLSPSDAELGATAKNAAAVDEMASDVTGIEDAEAANAFDSLDAMAQLANLMAEPSDPEEQKVAQPSEAESSDLPKDVQATDEVSVFEVAEESSDAVLSEDVLAVFAMEDGSDEAAGATPSEGGEVPFSPSPDLADEIIAGSSSLADDWADLLAGNSLTGDGITEGNLVENDRQSSGEIAVEPLGEALQEEVLLKDERVEPEKLAFEQLEQAGLAQDDNAVDQLRNAFSDLSSNPEDSLSLPAEELSQDAFDAVASEEASVLDEVRTADEIDEAGGQTSDSAGLPSEEIAGEEPKYSSDVSSSQAEDISSFVSELNDADLLSGAIANPESSMPVGEGMASEEAMLDAALEAVEASLPQSEGSLLDNSDSLSDSLPMESGTGDLTEASAESLVALSDAAPEDANHGAESVPPSFALEQTADFELNQDLSAEAAHVTAAIANLNTNGASPLLDPTSAAAPETEVPEVPNPEPLTDPWESLVEQSEERPFAAPAVMEEVALDESTPAETALAPEPFSEGTYIQDFEHGTFIQGITDQLGEESAPVVDDSESRFGTSLSDLPLADAPVLDKTAEPDISQVANEGTYIQDFENGTFIQGITEQNEGGADESPSTSDSPSASELEHGTFIQGITELGAVTSTGETPQETENLLAPESKPLDDSLTDDWGLSEQPDSDVDATNNEEALNSELQAFIAQAAAESAGLEAPATPPIEENLQAESSEAADPGEVASIVEASIEPILDEGLPEGTAELAGSGTSSCEAPLVQPSEQLGEAEVSLEAQQPLPQDLPVASELNEPLQELPSLEGIFDVAPEQINAIANTPSTLESAVFSEPAISEQLSRPGEESLQAESLEVEGGTSEESVSGELTEPADSVPAPVEAAPADVTESNNSNQTSKIETTDAAVQVALAEHQASPAISDPANSNSSLNDAVLAVEKMFGQLPTSAQPLELTPPASTRSTAVPSNQEGSNSISKAVEQPKARPDNPKADEQSKAKKKRQGAKLSGISVRVDLSVLERMNNLVGELVLSRNSLSLQQEQLQSVVTQLSKRFKDFDLQVSGLRKVSDQMLVEPAQRQAGTAALTSPQQDAADGEDVSLLDGFDVLEMDRYGALHGQLQEIFEQLMQLEEGVDDIGVLLEQSTQSLTQQRQRLSLLQNELMWARMLPLDHILGRFPRVLRDLARKHKKSVDLNMNGTNVLVDKGILEKLHDPMLHLLRNAFDHGIEMPEVRKSQGKAERGEIQINAYYQGNQTVVEIKDDGQGINLERIAKRAIELGWLSREEIKSVPKQALLDLIFEPGFSTAAKLSDLSGRGVGLDVVREQVKALKGSVTVNFEKDEGTTFTLRLPLTLTVAKLMVCQVGSTVIALPSDGMEDLLVPDAEQIKKVGHKRFLHWRNDLVPIESMAELLDYRCPTPDVTALKDITSKSIPVPQDWALPLLIFSRGNQRCAMEVNRLLMEQELVIKPFSSAITPPNYSYGCTILGDGRMVPVLDGTALLQKLSDQSIAVATGVELEDESLELPEDASPDAPSGGVAQAQNRAPQAQTILVVDDSTAMRRTIALSLEKAGYRVLQASDGQEALTQLRQSSSVQLVICDVEMPNMNGFEFLSQRRREPQLMKVPVVMLTSRSSDKHRRLAMQLKAHDYFSKPYVEQDFLKSIKQLLSTVAAV